MKKILILIFICASCAKQDVNFCDCVKNDIELSGEMITDYLQNNGQEGFVYWLENMDCVLSVEELSPLKTCPLTYMFRIEFEKEFKILYISNLKFIYYEN